MFIAVSNSHGRGKGTTMEEARSRAAGNSAVKRWDSRLRVRVWPCEGDAYVDAMGTVHGATGAGTEYKPLGVSKWGITSFVD